MTDDITDPNHRPLPDPSRYEYEDQVERLTNILRYAEGWGDGYQSSMGQTLIQLVADATDILHYMLERRSREVYLPTAKLRSSILALAGHRGYRPRRNVSSRGVLQLGLKNKDGITVAPIGNVFLPVHTEVRSEDYRFVTTEDCLVTPDKPIITIPVMEGTSREAIFDPVVENSIVHANHILIPDYDGVEEFSIIIDEPDTQFVWRDVRISYDNAPPVGNLSFLGPGEKFYDIRPSVDGLRIVFGNGEYGKAPDRPIRVRWIESSGKDLKMFKHGLPFYFNNDTVLDDIQTVPRNRYYYDMWNITHVRGGLPAETLDEIKTNSIEFVRTGDRAVTRVDYDHILLASGIGSLVDLNTYGEMELGMNLFRMNHLFAAYLTQTRDTLSSNELIDLRKWIEKYSIGLPHLSLYPAEELLYQYNLEVSLHRDLRASNKEIYDHIIREIGDLFIPRRGHIGKPFYKSKLCHFLEEMHIQKHGLTQKIARFIKLDVNPVYRFHTEHYTNVFDVIFLWGAFGDTYTLNITHRRADGTTFVDTFSHSIGIEDDLESLVARFEEDLGVNYIVERKGVLVAPGNFLIPLDIKGKTHILGDPEYGKGMFGTAGDDSDKSGHGIKLRVYAHEETSFYVDSDGTSDLSKVILEREIQLPPRFLHNRFRELLVVPGSIELMNEDLEVLMTDDGRGLMVDASGEDILKGRVDYVRATIDVPLLPEGDYYIRYREDEFGNVKPNERTFLTQIDPASFNMGGKSLSSIRFV